MTDRPGSPGKRLELAAVLLLFLAALVPRLRDLGASFDREMEGFQGSCFAGFAVNYERFGLWTWGGYPTFNIIAPADPEATPYLYPNHPPLVPLLGWSSLKLLGPEGWNEAWRASEPPVGAEAALRAPFFLAHLLGLLALWWAVRQGGGARRALLTLALAACVPLSIVYATLVNYEHAYLVLLLPAVGLHVRWLRGGGARELFLAAAFLFGAASVTFFPAFFVPPLVLQTWRRLGFRSALRQGVLFALAALGPAVLHVLWVRANVPPPYPAAVGERMYALWEPLISGSAPFGEWARRQLLRATYFFTTPLLGAAAVGLVLLLARALRKSPPGERAAAAPVSLGLPLAGGGLLILVGFYGHTFDGEHATNGQTIFLLNLVPGLAVLGAQALDAAAPLLARLRGGLAPLVVVTSLLALPGLRRAGELHAAWREPGPADSPPGSLGPATPLPITSGREIAAILPPDTVGLYPRGMGLSAAVRYYAWRQLFPVDRATWGDVITRINGAFGLTGVPRYMLIPKDPPPRLRAKVAEIRADLAEHFELLAETDRWELWPSFK